MTVSGNLPPGMIFTSSSQMLSGPATVGAGGIYNLVFTLENAFGKTEAPFELTVLEPPALSSADTIIMALGQHAREVITASGFPRKTMAISFSFTPTPGLAFLTFGQTLDVATLEGTPGPGAVGTHAIGLIMKNDPAPGFETTATLSLVVRPSITPASESVCPGSTGNTATGPAGLAAYAWTIVNGTITSGATAQTVTYTAGPSGQVTLTLAATSGAQPAASNSFAVPIVSAPTVIVAPPANATVQAGSPTTFGVTATGINLKYQWRKNLVNIPGATAATYPIASVTPAHAGRYDVVVQGCGTPLVSASAALTVATATDADGDGVPDALEAAGPNGGDANGDGIPDRTQSTVVTLASAGGGHLTLVSSCPLFDVSTRAVQAKEDPGYSYPFGTISFRAPCSSATFSLFVRGPFGNAPTEFRKHGPNPPGSANVIWYTLFSANISDVVIGGEPAKRIDFSLTDGGVGDDTGVDGIIVDEAGLADVAAPIPVLSPYGLLVLAVLLAMAGVVVRRRATGRGRTIPG